MQRTATIAIVLGLFATESMAMNISSHLRKCKQDPNAPSYGDNKCRCIGIDNMKGYYAAQVQYHHVQYTAETGASCAAWDSGKHPECEGDMGPAWCKQEWCYVDPCSCDIDTPPKPTVTGATYQGSPAYWSYASCGGMDLFSASNEKACIHQKSVQECAAQPKCAWDGKRCGGKEVVQNCQNSASKDATLHGEEDCRCIGLSGRKVGKAVMNIDDDTAVQYPVDVGGTCGAWESEAHPDCKKADAPAWCSAKWCFVDPCKCTTKANVAPKAVMPANAYMRFQGKTAYFSYNTCGNPDSWSSTHGGYYCPMQTTEQACKDVGDSKCIWNGEKCMAKALADICEKQRASGILGVEAQLPGSGSMSIAPLKSVLAMIGAIAMAQ